MIKTFRGTLISGKEDRIRLSTKQGKIGYKVIKFQCMESAPFTADTEAIVKITKIPQTTIDGNVDFADNTLLGVEAYKSGSGSTEQYDSIVIFDREIFNQDIYVSNYNIGAPKMNYYIELEQIKLDLSENTVATLKDIRNLEPGG